jgi:hypothetical protein
MNHPIEGGWLKSSALFPSPCGEVVMNQLTESICRFLATVSVPLRGSGNESTGAVATESGLLRKFPSPCGEVVMNRS